MILHKQHKKNGGLIDVNTFEYLE